MASSQKPMFVYLFIGGTIFFTVLGQLSLKAGMLEVGAVPGDLAALPAFLGAAFTNVKVVVGLASAVMAAVLWMGAVSRSDISFAYPFMALAIVLVLALSGVVFGEQVSTGRWLGVLIVCLGLIIAARS
ncbi:MAG: hypothetical protein KIS63_10900 [Caldilineales bacterium]|nr:hypothetical protein [Caldilineales bacterium]